MLKRIAQNHPPAIAQLGVTFAREKHVFNHQLKMHTANRVASSFSLPPHAHHARGCKQHMRSWPVFRSFYTCLSQAGKTCHSWIMARSVVVGGKIRNLPSSCKTAPKHHHLSATRFDALSVKQAQEWEIKVSTPSGRCAIWLDRLVCFEEKRHNEEAIFGTSVNKTNNQVLKCVKRCSSKFQTWFYHFIPGRKNFFLGC